MNHQVPIDRIHANVPKRKPGYLAACLETGRAHGGMIEFTTEQFAWLRQKYSLDATPRRGLGDRVHAIAGPIGKALHWPCLEKGSTQLKPRSLCQHLRQTLNKIQL